VLITGGTGSFGKTLTKILLKEYQPKKLIIFSRDELKQSEMQQFFPEDRISNIRYFLGNVRDKDRLYRAFDGVDFVVHAAALKQVPAAEYNPFEVIKTNVLGAENIIEAAIDRGVEKVVALSTDKAANPINLYGASKLCSDKLFIAGNAYTGKHRTKFSVVRYGNVVGSRGSVIPFFLKEKHKGILSVTDFRMTRFWITLDDAVRFVLMTMTKMIGGELFVPRIPSMKIVDLAKAIAPDCRLREIGVRPGEKLHEVLITRDDSRYTKEFDQYFVTQPKMHWWNNDHYQDALLCPEGFVYSSDRNQQWLTSVELKSMMKLDGIPFDEYVPTI